MASEIEREESGGHRRVRRFLGFCVGCVVWLGVGVAGAYFTGQAQVADNIIRAGVVSVSIEPSSTAVMIDPLAPGESATRQMTLSNDGNLTASVVVTGSKKAGITEFWEALSCKVTAAGLAVYDGPLSALRTTAVQIKPGEKLPLLVTVTLPASAGNALMGDYVKMSFYADAEQVHAEGTN